MEKKSVSFKEKLNKFMFSKPKVEQVQSNESDHQVS